MNIKNDNLELRELILRLCTADNKIEEQYRFASAKFQIPESALDVFYCLSILEKPITQSELCNIFFQSKQTINSSLKNLIKQGYIELIAVDGNKKNKIISLTKKGNEFALKTAGRLLLAEMKAISSLSFEERTTLISLYEKFAYYLEEEYKKI